MKKGLFVLVLVCFSNMLFAQEDAWIYLEAKQNVATYISNPISILTQKAVDRKNAHGVVIDARDMPVNETYISQLKTATGITVMAKSKWFNAVHVRGTEVDINNLKTTFSFVDRIDFANKSLNGNKSVKQKKQSKLENILTDFAYGSAANQNQMVKVDQLHKLNYTGTGMTVAVLDAGFTNVNTMAAFQRLRNAGNIKGVYDFVDRDDNVYTNTSSDHGTWVLSTMAGYIENQYVGTAPDATYYLFTTEDGSSENPVEESYWVEAAERADSLGVDVINTSLGYTTYDNSNYSYTTANMDGNTAFITKGANIAFEKGMLLVTSAGNDGANAWQIVGAPADATGVFTIGSVNSLGVKAASSSIGSVFQSSQKPDVVAQGEGSAIITKNDIISTASGTSFSSPIMAGGMVCLWQALPNKTNAEIMQLVRQSASQFNNPDYFLGYGIPNLQTALNLALNIQNNFDASIKVYPNPVKERIYFEIPSEESQLNIALFDMLGKQVLNISVDAVNNQIDVSSLSKGLYILRLNSKKTSKSFKIIKQ
ncbi:putative secreted protein (Por secretion system target) [Mariniflexile fucanivorans]|uniref:Putative secreted protein (Por secretion system target) n=1 Tax=Mariniflexile fucanivorans TaxID=264023 RepID=A0A4R1RQ29_9FLAO|nr:S8 family serine peptidase [Mariniflexile fucanivorans]TCL68002.1 putative secreted protein (Por secretion system target) [Mariniflexile fucanivorans]